MNLKEIDLDLSKVNILGDIIDIGKRNYGIIYCLSKFMDDEICIDYYEIESNDRFSNAILFFNICNLSINISRESIIKEAYDLLKENGNILIWDYEKNQKEFLNLKVNVKLPNNTLKSFYYKDLNILNKFTLKDAKKIVEKYFFIEEVEVCDKIYFIKGKKKGRNDNENLANSDKL